MQVVNSVVKSIATCKVVKVLGTTMAKTNKLFNKCVKVEVSSIELEKLQIDMSQKLSNIRKLIK